MTVVNMIVLYASQRFAVDKEDSDTYTQIQITWWKCEVPKTIKNIKVRLGAKQQG